jgi:hypothetical protein
MLAVIRLALFSYWVDDYHGGAIAAIGGALVLGALPRLIRNGRTRDGLFMSAGIAILANSRPYEGLLVCVPVVCFLVWRAIRKRPAFSVLVRRGTLAVSLLLVVAPMMGFYNYRVFGSPLTLPYQVNRMTYASAPVFVWEKPRPEPVYRHKVMRDFYSTWEMRDFRETQTTAGFMTATTRKLGIGIFFFCGIAILPPLICLPRVFRDRRVRFLVVAGVVYAIGLSANVWLFPHYLAPFTCAVYALLLQGMRHLRVWRPGGLPRGEAIVRAIPIVCLVLAGVRLFASPLNVSIPRWPTMWYGTEPLGLPRARVQAELEGFSGPQLAIVRYSPDHAPFDDWVYNAADIDRSHVVWAREMGSEDNARLLRYFHDRTVWLVEPDARPPAISPYPQEPMRIAVK